MQALLSTEMNAIACGDGKPVAVACRAAPRACYAC